MITLLFYVMFMIAGYLIAAVDWRQFLSNSFRFSDINHQGRFVLCLAMILALYTVPLVVCIKVYDAA